MDYALLWISVATFRKDMIICGRESLKYNLEQAKSKHSFDQDMVWHVNARASNLHLSFITFLGGFFL